MSETPGPARRRLRAIERRLVDIGADPMLTDEEIGDLSAEQAERIARAEVDRLALLAQLADEQGRGSKRARPTRLDGDGRLTAALDRRFPNGGAKKAKNNH